jgi:hypothetical protein
VVNFLAKLQEIDSILNTVIFCENCLHMIEARLAARVIPTTEFKTYKQVCFKLNLLVSAIFEAASLAAPPFQNFMSKKTHRLLLAFDEYLIKISSLTELTKKSKFK